MPVLHLWTRLCTEEIAGTEGVYPFGPEELRDLHLRFPALKRRERVFTEVSDNHVVVLDLVFGTS